MVWDGAHFVREARVWDLLLMFPRGAGYRVVGSCIAYWSGIFVLHFVISTRSVPAMSVFRRPSFRWVESFCRGAVVQSRHRLDLLRDQSIKFKILFFGLASGYIAKHFPHCALAAQCDPHDFEGCQSHETALPQRVDADEFSQSVQSRVDLLIAR